MTNQNNYFSNNPNDFNGSFWVDLLGTLIYHVTDISKAFLACGVKANTAVTNKQSKEFTGAAIIQKAKPSNLTNTLHSKNSEGPEVLTTYSSLTPIQLKLLFEFMEDHKIFHEDFNLIGLRSMLLGQPDGIVELKNARRLACLFEALAKDKRINPNWKKIIFQGEYFRGKICKNPLSKAGLSAALSAGKKDVVFAEEVNYFINYVLINSIHVYEFERRLKSKVC